MVTLKQQPDAVCGLIPVKNAMPYLRQTLESIAAQTHASTRLIAWDNGSTDGSLEELRRWIPSRIPGEVIADRPLPLGKCRAALVEHADTEFCAWFDADDVYAANRLEKQVHALRDHPDAALVGAAMRVIDQHGKPTGELRQGETRDADLRWALRFGNPIAQPTVLFRRSAVLAAGNYPDRNGDEDYAMWARLSRTHRLINLDDVLVDYRVHDTNITHRFTPNLQSHRRERQEALHDDLFPGLGVEQTVQLYASLCPHEARPIHREDLRRLGKAARCLSQQTGIPLAAFKRTRIYRQQRLNLLTRYLKSRVVLRQAWPVLQSIKRLASPRPSTTKQSGDRLCHHA